MTQFAGPKIYATLQIRNSGVRFGDEVSNFTPLRYRRFPLLKMHPFTVSQSVFMHDVNFLSNISSDEHNSRYIFVVYHQRFLFNLKNIF